MIAVLYGRESCPVKLKQDKFFMQPHDVSISTQNTTYQLDIVGTVYHLVIYMQSNKIHSVF